MRLKVENTFTAIIKKVDWGYVGYVAELPGANTQGTTVEETRSNLKEALIMILDANREKALAHLDGNDIREEIKIVSA
jgi:predicted RNase H-like HicB family nuclease